MVTRIILILHEMVNSGAHRSGSCGKYSQIDFAIMGKVYPDKNPMDAISYTTAAQNLAQTLDRVCDDHETIIVTREAQRSVVIMSLDDYNSLEATMHLLRSPKNAERLMASIAQLEAGNGTARELLD
jgi:antitoxin YefM